MTYNDVNSYTSHAGVFARKAESLFRLLDSELWEAKIRHADRITKQAADELNMIVEEIDKSLKACLKDLEPLREEIKIYK